MQENHNPRRYVVARRVNKWKVNDHDYLDAITAGDIEKARGLENMLRLCAREPIFAAMVYV